MQLVLLINAANGNSYIVLQALQLFNGVMAHVQFLQVVQLFQSLNLGQSIALDAQRLQVFQGSQILPHINGINVMSFLLLCYYSYVTSNFVILFLPSHNCVKLTR